MDRQAELEQAFKNLSQNELEAVLDALTLVAGQYEMDQADKGIYLKAPYGELIASGEMKCFAKPKRDERLVGPRILLSDHKAFGVMRVGEPVIVGVGEFDELIGDHCIGRKDRLQWWPEREELWLYPIEEWKGYEAPIEVDLPPGVQGYVENMPCVEVKEIEVTEPLSLKVSLASTPLQAQKGFSDRASIDPSEGLLIPISDGVGIWMKDTVVPLSVAFLDNDYKVLQIDSLTPNDETVHMGPDGSAWALEASPEWFESVEMEVGDRVVGLKGGPGSGNRGHRGRPNLVGGSAPSGGPIAGGSLVTEPGSTDLRWRNEESVQGSIVIEMPSGVSASEASEGDLVDFIKTNIPQSEVRRIALLGLNDPISIEEVEITSREDRGDFVVLEVDILPSEEAAEEFFAGTIPFEQPERL
jgi:uncharacterized membrane protein (UPF0127 family)